MDREEIIDRIKALSQEIKENDDEFSVVISSMLDLIQATATLEHKILLVGLGQRMGRYAQELMKLLGVENNKDWLDAILRNMGNN